jgi:hypothetical protein
MKQKETKQSDSTRVNRFDNNLKDAKFKKSYSVTSENLKKQNNTKIKTHSVSTPFKLNNFTNTSKFKTGRNTSMTYCPRIHSSQVLKKVYSI